MEQLLFIGAIVIAIAAGLYEWWRRHRKREAFERLLKRDGLTPSGLPCGLSAGRLRHLRTFPQGDRRYGVEYGVTGSRQIEIAGEKLTVDCAAFRYWWEVRQTSTSSNGHSTTTYHKRTKVAGAINLPRRVPAVSIRPQGMLARAGIGGRGDFQVESDRFNRRFNVQVTGDPQLVIRLLDAQFQRFLLEMFDGREIELVDDALVVAGDPAGVQSDLFGDIGKLPAARRDAALIASRIPDSFWRGLDAARAESSR